VAVLGAQGRMGQNVVAAVNSASDMELVAQLDAQDDIPAALAKTDIDVGVDFTVPAVTEGNVKALTARGIHAVVGTTGWDESSLSRVEESVRGTNVGVLIAPNFSLCAVLGMRFVWLVVAVFGGAGGFAV